MNPPDEVGGLGPDDRDTDPDKDDSRLTCAVVVVLAAESEADLCSTDSERDAAFGDDGDDDDDAFGVSFGAFGCLLVRLAWSVCTMCAIACTQTSR